MVGEVGVVGVVGVMRLCSRCGVVEMDKRGILV